MAGSPGDYLMDAANVSAVGIMAIASLGSSEKPPNFLDFTAAIFKKAEISNNKIEDK